jgi:hypothetical protein
MHVRGYLQGSENGRVVTIAFGVTLALKYSLISCHVTELQIPIGWNLVKRFWIFKNLYLLSVNLIKQFNKLPRVYFQKYPLKYIMNSYVDCDAILQWNSPSAIINNLSTINSFSCKGWNLHGFLFSPIYIWLPRIKRKLGTREKWFAYGKLKLLSENQLQDVCTGGHM